MVWKPIWVFCRGYVINYTWRKWDIHCVGDKNTAVCRRESNLCEMWYKNNIEWLFHIGLWKDLFLLQKTIVSYYWVLSGESIQKSRRLNVYLFPPLLPSFLLFLSLSFLPSFLLSSLFFLRPSLPSCLLSSPSPFSASSPPSLFLSSLWISKSQARE